MDIVRILEDYSITQYTVEHKFVSKGRFFFHTAHLSLHQNQIYIPFTTLYTKI